MSWGCNLRKQCGPVVDASIAVPTPLAPLAGMRMVSVAAGLNHSVALSEAGDVYSWGSNECGQLGLGTTKGSSPQLVDADTLQHERVAQIACGSRCDLLVQLHVFVCL